jgi:hypothetical protein
VGTQQTCALARNSAFFLKSEAIARIRVKRSQDGVNDKRAAARRL